MSRRNVNPGEAVKSMLWMFAILAVVGLVAAGAIVTLVLWLFARAVHVF